MNQPNPDGIMTPSEMRRHIQHLEKVIKSYEKRLKKKTEMLVERQEKLRYYRNKYNRFLARMTFLQEQHPEIDFGLDDFKQKYFAQRDAEQGEEPSEDSES